MFSGYPVWQLSIDHIVNVQCKRCGLCKTRLRHPSLPFDSLPYPTRTIRRRVRSVNHVTTKGKEVDHNLWVWGSVPRALRACVGAPLVTFQNPVNKRQKILVNAKRTLELVKGCFMCKGTGN